MPYTGKRRLLLFLHLSEALAAVYRSVALGLEGNSCFLAASCACSCEVLSGALNSHLSLVSAGLAALGLVLEATLSVELLLAGCEYELLAAFLTYKCLVFVHVVTSLFPFREE